MIWLYDCIVEIEMFIKLTSFCNINISDKYPVRSVKHKMNEKNSTNSISGQWQLHTYNTY